MDGGRSGFGRHENGDEVDRKAGTRSCRLDRTTTDFFNV